MSLHERPRPADPGGDEDIPEEREVEGGRGRETPAPDVETPDQAPAQP